MGYDGRNPYFVACEQQRRRPACASAQSDQRLCHSLHCIWKVKHLLILHFGGGLQHDTVSGYAPIKHCLFEQRSLGETMACCSCYQIADNANSLDPDQAWQRKAIKAANNKNVCTLPIMQRVHLYFSLLPVYKIWFDFVLLYQPWNYGLL